MRTTNSDRGPERAFGIFMAAVLFWGCAPPNTPIDTNTDRLTLYPGGSGSIVVSIYAEPKSDVTFSSVTPIGASPGIEHWIDKDLTSPDTPFIRRLQVRAAPDAVAGDYYILLYATVDNYSVPKKTVRIRVIEAPVQSEVNRIVAGASHSIAIGDGGTKWAWGRNLDGELGTGRMETTGEPESVDRSNGGFANVFATANAHANVAIKANDELFVWGSDFGGQLGVGSDVTNGPVFGPKLEMVRKVVFGSGFALALTGDGSVWGWGGLSIAGTDSPVIASDAPQQILEPGSAIDIEAGATHALVLTESGHVLAWGSNSDGQLGTPTSGDLTSPTDIFVGDYFGEDAVDIAAGKDFSLALLESGTVVAWGSNEYGQLGTTGLAGSATPIAVSGLPGVEAVHAGDRTAAVVTRQGEAWIWGTVFGQPDLGLTALPHRIDELPPVKSIALGNDHGLALAACGQVWTFGRNDFNQLGRPQHARRWAAPILNFGRATDCAMVVLQIDLIGNGDISVSDAEGELSCSESKCIGIYARNSVVELDVQTGTDANGLPIEVSPVSSCFFQSQDGVLTMSKDMRCSIEYASDNYNPHRLTVSATNGTVVSGTGGIWGPENLDCGPVCNAIFPDNFVVDLAATPNGGFLFAAWGGDCSGTDAITTLAMDANHTCEAQFEPDSGTDEFRIRVTIDNNGGSPDDWVYSFPDGLDCYSGSDSMSNTGVCEAAFTDDTVFLYAQAATNDAADFLGWSSNCDAPEPGTCAITNPGNSATIEVEAMFAP